MDDFLLGPVEVHPALNQIRIEDRPVRVQPKAMRLLEALAARPGRVMSRDDLAERVWSGRSPSDEVIARTVASLRKSLGDDPRRPRFVETIPKQGYRLVAPVTQTSPSRAAPRWHRWGWLVATGLLVVLPFAFLLSRRPEPASSFELSARIAVGLAGYEEAPALDPDGRRLAFSYAPPGTQRHRIRIANLAFPGDGLRILGRQQFDDRYPAWSPDGQALAFIRRNGPDTCSIVRVGLATGTERRITRCRANIITPLDWTRDGSQLIYADHSVDQPGQYRLYRVRAAGGSAPRQLTAPEDPALSDWWPRVSPDGRQLAHIRGQLNDQRIVLTDLEDGGTRFWGGGGEGFLYGLTWLDDGSGVIYAFRGNDDVFNLWYLPRDRSEAIRIGGRNWALPQVRGGVLAAVQLNHDFDVFRLDLMEPRGGVTRAVFDSSGLDGEPSLSPDGRQAVLISNRSGHRALWLTPLDDPDGALGMELLRPESGRLRSPTWSNDGRRVAVLETGGGRSLVWLLVLASRSAELVHAGRDQLAALSFSADDSSLLMGSDRDGNWQIWRLDLSSREFTRVTREGGYIGRESLDGRWLFFMHYLSDGLYRMPIEDRDVEAPELWFPKVAWLNRENWFATERGLVVPLEADGGRPAGLYRIGDDRTASLVSPAELYQSVKPEQRVAVDRQGRIALVVRPAIYQGNIVLVDLRSVNLETPDKAP